MKVRILFLFLSVAFADFAKAQTIANLLEQAFQQFHRDTCLTNADISFTLLDIKNGKLIFEHNKDLPLAPASTLKTFTTGSALKILGEDYRYETKIKFRGKIENGNANGQLIVYACGDPSLGSDRYPDTRPEEVYKNIGTALRKMGVKKFSGNIQVIKNIFTDEAINTGWLDEDIGNAYGAGIYPLNWKENKFELNLSVSGERFIVSSNTAGYDNKRDFCIEIKQKEGSTTEEVFAFVEKNKSCRYTIRGVLAKKKEPQNLPMARLSPDRDFVQDLGSYLKREFEFQYQSGSYTEPEVDVSSIYSPPLSQLVYWCNQKSLNLYAESLCKTLAVQLFKKGSWELGLAAMLRFATALQLNTKGVKLKDACGLAPENRITTALLAGFLQKFTQEKTYPVFYKSLPSINGLIMKSGYIGGTRSYAGYIKLKDSTDACFAFIMHNYTCSPREVKGKMFQLLDKLKP